ncbi:EGF domain-specific O-linked N-acetylglucosamine transferase [Lachnellula occidentalis]|uniref:EGF domain-specific O-linked N-acetylglucosamine transferase n=1 Tax=Lachnellula occidentalis TaxID=215460 RepID=A0A8H8U9J0_9HELO|nr:EGF domain-specific O-linked N-acetylglucosamine transferase [Lachnellula occidentalis]
MFGSRPVRIWGSVLCYLVIAIFVVRYYRPHSTRDDTSPSRGIFGGTPQLKTTESTLAVAYPIDYLPSPKDEEECERLYSPRYLDFPATHHIPYCEDGSQSSLECFRTHRNESMCLVKRLLIDQTRTEPNHHTAMQCHLRNFTVEAEADAAAAEALHGVLSVDSMPVGFFDTGVPAQLRSWDLDASDESMAEKCGLGNTDGKWTLLVKRENHHNVFHKMLELWQAMVSLDVLQIAVDPSTQEPYLHPSDLANMQVVFTDGDEGLVDDIDGWWNMVTGKKPILQKDMQPACLDKVILPLAGSFSPFWAWHWVEKDCHDTFLLDAFLTRIYRFLDIEPKKHGGEEKTIVTIVDRKGRRKLRDMEALIASAQARWPKVIFKMVDFGSISLKEQVLVARNTSVFVGLTGAAMTHIFWLPEESSVAEIQAPNKRLPEAQPYAGFRNLAKMRNMHYFTAHPERRVGDPGNGSEWQTGEWVDIKPEVFQTLLDAAIYAQIHKGSSPGEVLPVGNIPE